MKSNQSVRKRGSLFPGTVGVVLLTITASLTASQRIEAATNVAVWDTGSRFADTTGDGDRTGWKSVPSELFALEADPPKAASDPGYYGREYSFKGDAVVENRSLTAVFWSAKGRVVIYSKAEALLPAGPSPGNPGFGKKILEFVPLQTKAKPGMIARCEILRNGGDEVVMDVSFSAKGSADLSAVFSFGKNEIVEIKPAEGMKGISLLSPIEYGVVPGFIGDDLIFGATEYASPDALSIPAENVFVGLLKGECRRARSSRRARVPRVPDR